MSLIRNGWAAAYLSFLAAVIQSDRNFWKDVILFSCKCLNFSGCLLMSI